MTKTFSKKRLLLLSQCALSFVLMVGIVAPVLPGLGYLEPAIAQPTKKKKVVVVDFDFANTGDSSYWYSYRGSGAARGISELLINKLVNDGTYSVISRGAVENYLKEKGISGAMDEATAVKIGKALGVDAVIVGTVTRFNVETKRASGGLFGIGGNSETQKATVQLTARAVDTTTQSIIAAWNSVGESSTSSGGGSVFGIGGSSGSSGTDEILSKAADDATSKIVKEMKNKL
ncbi:MAG: penicillin-binding protein activator LpoB [Leptolyngbya sp.]|nr:MAG: penicillin-binding protein activator LpoB [Leptolyngbya sp.]